MDIVEYVFSTNLMSNQNVHQMRKLRRVEVEVRPKTRFPVPISDGYSVYSALLSVLQHIDEDVSAHIHDAPLGSLHSSGLLGIFGDSDRSFHKTVRPDETYQLTLGIIDPSDKDIFQTLVTALVLEGDTINLSHGALTVESFESVNTTHEALLDEAGSLSDPTIGLSFETATCIEEAGDVTTMFPTRTAVFSSLLGKWNNTAPEDIELDITREALAASVIEKPDARSYQTNSVLVNRVENSDGNTHPIFKQGFSGDCAYEFKDASDSVKNAVTALALFAEYAGVGSAVARGCGSVEVNMK